MADREDLAVDTGEPTFEPVKAGRADVTELLDRLVTFPVAALPPVGAASVSLAGGPCGRMDTLTATSRDVRDLDAMQYRTGSGPCLQAIDRGQEVMVAIPSDRWPDFSAAAEAAGFGFVWALPLGAPPRIMGTLTLYSPTRPDWPGMEATTIRLLAALTARGLADIAATAKVKATNAKLEAALETRSIIGEAKGLLMAWQNIDGDEAFDILRRASQRTNRKARDIAAEMVARVCYPGAGPAQNPSP